MDVSASLTSFLETLPTEKLQGLYDNQWTCQAVFRSLPSLAKHYCLRLLVVDTSLNKTLIDGWLKSEIENKQTVEKLKRLQLVQISRSESGEEMVSLHTVFQHHLQLSMSGEGVLHSDVSDEVMSFIPSTEELTQFANDRWEALLLYLSGATTQPLAKSHHLQGKEIALDHLLEFASLAEIQSSGRVSITTEGFRFLLLDQSSQLWKLVSQYIIAAETAMGTDLGKLFNFLLELGFRPPNKPGNVSLLDSVQHNVATHMEQLGVLKTFKTSTDEIYYVPTPMASCFCTIPTTSTPSIHLSGSVVIETNFKVYGYTSSVLFRTVLDLFCRCDYAAPNFYVGNITRESIADALECGLTADLIIRYLHTHAHATIQERTNIVPHNVVNQIRLWESDIYRVKFEDAVLFENFPSDDTTDIFCRTVTHAKEQHLHLWDDGETKIISKISGHELLTRFIQQNT